MGNVIGYIIFLLVCALFVVIGIVSWNSKAPVGFFSNVKAPDDSDISDIKGYNHAVARIWFVFAGGLALLGLPLLAGQNSPLIIITVIGSLWLCIALIVVYMRVEKKYKGK